jgi:23S rRNA (guanosine2251-2'-O)-methyltransferase
VGVAKTALGAEKWTPWSYHAKVSSAIDSFEKQGIPVAALELTSDAVSVFDLKPAKRMALVIGNEISGVSPEALNRCAIRLFVPMMGRKGSLNVSSSSENQGSWSRTNGILNRSL